MQLYRKYTDELYRKYTDNFYPEVSLASICSNTHDNSTHLTQYPSSGFTSRLLTKIFKQLFNVPTAKRFNLNMKYTYMTHTHTEKEGKKFLRF